MISSTERQSQSYEDQLYQKWMILGFNKKHIDRIVQTLETILAENKKEMQDEMKFTELVAIENISNVGLTLNPSKCIGF